MCARSFRKKQEVVKYDKIKKYRTKEFLETS